MIPTSSPLLPTSTPTQIGYIQSGVRGPIFTPSEVVIGRDVTGSWEAAGFGAQGRPDALQKITINLSPQDGLDLPGKIIIDVQDVLSIMDDNDNAPDNMYFRLTEVSICESGVEKRMVVLASQTYLPSD